MKTLELFCGTKSFSKVMETFGHSIYTIDSNCAFIPTECVDIFVWKPPKDVAGTDLLWASPPCQSFSVATIGRNWNKDYTPKTDSAKISIALIKRTIKLIGEINPTWWFIENPRGMLRKLPLLSGAIRKTVTYCGYGDKRMKPTDIWTNAYWWNPKLPCKNGDPCHESAPRGSRTGTQGLNGATERGKIPARLFEEILEQMPK